MSAKVIIGGRVCAGGEMSPIPVAGVVRGLSVAGIHVVGWSAESASPPFIGRPFPRLSVRPSGCGMRYWPCGLAAARARDPL